MRHVLDALLRLLMLGYVDRHGVAPGDSSLFGRTRQNLDLDPPLFSAFEPHLPLISNRMAAERFAEMPFDIRIGRVSDNFAQRRADSVGHGKAEKIRVALIRENAMHLPVDIQDHRRHVIGQQAKLGFAVAQCLFRLLAFGDVGVDGKEAAARQRRSTDLQHDPVRPRAFEHMGLHFSGTL